MVSATSWKTRDLCKRIIILSKNQRHLEGKEAIDFRVKRTFLFNCFTADKGAPYMCLYIKNTLVTMGENKNISN